MREETRVGREESATRNGPRAAAGDRAAVGTF